MKTMLFNFLNPGILELRALSEAEIRLATSKNLWNALSQDVVQIENINRFIRSSDKLTNNRLEKQ